MHKLTIWLKNKRIFILMPVFLLSITVQGQPKQRLTLEEVYQLAYRKYPVIRQRDLVKQTAVLSVENLNKGYLPQITIGGQASYQSDVTKVSVPLPGINIPSPSKDQYKITAEALQVLYDGGIIKQQKETQRLTADAEEQKVEVELYKLKERLNQLYLGILYLEEQLKQLDLLRKDIEMGIRRVEAQVQNGVALKSNLNVLKAELLKNDQRLIEIRSSRKSFIDMLALFIGSTIDEQVILEEPAPSPNLLQNDIKRPELQLYTSQGKILDQQQHLIRARTLPKTSLFIQGGYGRPGLNMLENKFDWFYIGGLRFNWSLGGYYTNKKEIQLTEINKRIIDIQKETFILNTNTLLVQQLGEINKLEKLIASDQEIIDLRIQIKDAAKAQLENSVITANDYLREVNAEDQARQALITHQIQLLQARINYQTISGKQ